MLEKENKRPQKIIIASNEIEGNIVRDLLTFSDKTGISLARLPKMTDLESDINDKKPKIKPIDVFDLLSRPQSLLDRNSMKKLIYNKKVLSFFSYYNLEIPFIFFFPVFCISIAFSDWEHLIITSAQYLAY